VLPIELRRTLDIDVKDSLEIFVEDNGSSCKKMKNSCVFCGSTEDISVFKGKHICASCIESLSK
jgi:transcriptional pleiotropic regulator of transition state genes